MKIKLLECILEDTYPVHAGYAYVVDGKPLISDISGSVLTLKRHYGASEIKNCDIFGRQALEDEKKD